VHEISVSGEGLTEVLRALRAEIAAARDAEAAEGQEDAPWRP
jgi:hypothetical protein